VKRRSKRRYPGKRGPAGPNRKVFQRAFEFRPTAANELLQPADDFDAVRLPQRAYLPFPLVGRPPELQPARIIAIGF